MTSLAALLQRRADLRRLAAELDAVYEPPTACRPDDLPDQESGPRYPLVRIERQRMSAPALLAYLVRLWIWRWRERYHNRIG